MVNFIMERNIKLEDLLHLHCGACLCELAEIKHDVTGMARSLLKLFKKCAGLRKTQLDLYPKFICGECFQSLKSFDEFQEKTKESTKFLKDLLKSYKPNEELFPAQESNESSSVESESSLLKSEEFQGSVNEEKKVDNDPLQWQEFHAEFTGQKESKTKELKQKEENDFESILVKMEVKESEESFNLDKKTENETENYDFYGSSIEKSVSPSKKLKREIKCRVCVAVFKNAKSLRSHMEEEHDEQYIFSCNQCDRGFNRKSRLNIHLNEIHGDSPTTITCKFGCGKFFRRVQTAANHYRLKHQSTEQQNEIADQSTKTVEKQKIFPKNENKSDDDNDETYNQLEKEADKLPKMKKKICTICFGMFSSNTALRKHMNIHQDVRPFQCDKCERGFNCKSRLQKHMRELHSENPVEFVCKFGCGKTFKTSDSAGNHYRRQHSGKVIKSEKVTCICEDCGRVFKCMTRLRQHSYQHRPVEERPYHCEVCNKRFVFKKTYKEHLLRHKGIKEFECPQCGLKKTTKQELRNHMKYHTDELKVSCPLCQKIFGNPPNLRRHIQLVHEGVKNFKCRFCDEAFGKAETLKHHEMRHTGEKPHKCEICDKSFIQLVALRTHMKTHNKLPRAPKTNRNAEAALIYEPTALMNISENTL